MSLNTCRIEEIEKTLSEADRGDFASDEETDLLLTKWSRATSFSHENDKAMN